MLRFVDIVYLVRQCWTVSVVLEVAVRCLGHAKNEID